MSSYDMDRGTSGIVSSYTNEEINKDLQVGKKIRLRHFNIGEYAISVVKEFDEHSLKIKITDEMLKANVLPGDQVLAVFINNENEECVINGIVENMEFSFPQFYQIRVIRIERYKDWRKNKRYAIDAGGLILEQNHVFYGIVKNVSFNGIKLISKKEIEDRGNIRLQIIIDEKKSLTVDMGVVRKKQHYNFYEYGMVVLNSNGDERGQFNEIVEYVASKEEAWAEAAFPIQEENN